MHYRDERMGYSLVREGEIEINEICNLQTLLSQPTDLSHL